MMFKRHISDVPKPISDLFQTNNNYHSYSTPNSQYLRTPIGKSEVHCIVGLELYTLYLVKCLPMCFIYVFKILPNYIYGRIICHILD